jgi:zinc D-Ala-D-Ala carboxypeptidase
MKHSKHYYEKDRNLPINPVREIKFFTLDEFDSPDLKGSGEKMSLDFVRKLDEARELAGVPFKINSGYRTKEYNISLKKRGYHASPTSAHMKGLAADISTPDSKTRFLVLESLIKVGFRRIGIGKTFIHADIDESKSQEVLWTYYK